MEGKFDNRVSHEKATDRDEAERTVRSALAQISEVIEQLERTCRTGRITSGEVTEERDLLQAQRQPPNAVRD